MLRYLWDCDKDLRRGVGRIGHGRPHAVIPIREWMAAAPSRWSRFRRLSNL